VSASEFNFDGLVGPTHNYSGLSYGNVASLANEALSSNPREAALQGLAKMKHLHDLGLAQAVIPPHERPDVSSLRRLGFLGDDADVVARAGREAPRLLAACSSASAMWTANAATVSPSSDTADGRVHFTPANLVDKFHRSLEAATTARLLRAIFPEGPHFAHHDPLPAVAQFGDEGAANHTRFCAAHGDPGLELFVYGRLGFGAADVAPGRYPARQSREAGESIARLHGLDAARCSFLQQNPAVIDAGVFHNDVIAVGNESVMLQHELAFIEASESWVAIRAVLGGRPFHRIMVSEARVDLSETVETYLFNSQLVTLPSGDMSLIVPVECRESPSVWAFLQEVLDGDNPIRSIEVLDLRQSMRNGGGPACLRLRLVLNESERRALSGGVVLDEPLYARLVQWVQRHYRDRLSGADLADAALLRESREALDELTAILGIGAVYPFQLD